MGKALGMERKRIANAKLEIMTIMKEKIREMLEDALPLVDFDSDFLFSELDSLGVTTILMKLADEYGIEMEASDATPKNLKSLDSIVALVERKISEKRL